MPTPRSPESARLLVLLEGGSMRKSAVIAELAAGAHPGRALREGQRIYEQHHDTAEGVERQRLTNIGRRSMATRAIQRALRRQRVVAFIGATGDEMLSIGPESWSPQHGPKVVKYPGRRHRPVSKPWSIHILSRVSVGPVPLSVLIDEVKMLVDDDEVERFRTKDRASRPAARLERPISDALGRNRWLAESARRRMVEETVRSFVRTGRIQITEDGMAIVGSNPWLTE